MNPAWEFTHSVECNASRESAWLYWTTVENWNDPPARFHLDGPFAAGSKLTTILPDQTLHSIIRHVEPGREAIIEIQLADAALSCHWKFDELDGNRTLLRQRMVLEGANAKAYVEQAAFLKQSVPDGMKKLAGDIERNRG